MIVYSERSSKHSEHFYYRIHFIYSILWTFNIISSIIETRDIKVRKLWFILYLTYIHLTHLDVSIASQTHFSTLIIQAGKRCTGSYIIYTISNTFQIIAISGMLYPGLSY